MNHLMRILPVVAAIAAVGAAIYHVRSNVVERPAAVEVKQQPAAAKHETLVPPSDRYANSAVGN